MATKYIVNTKKMAFSFQNGKVLERKGTATVIDSTESAETVEAKTTTKKSKKSTTQTEE